MYIISSKDAKNTLVVFLFIYLNNRNMGNNDMKLKYIFIRDRIKLFMDNNVKHSPIIPNIKNFFSLSDNFNLIFP